MAVYVIWVAMVQWMVNHSMVEYDAYVLRNDGPKNDLIWAIAMVFLWRYLKVRIYFHTEVDKTERSAVSAMDVEMMTRDMADFIRSLNNCIQVTTFNQM